MFHLLLGLIYLSGSIIFVSFYIFIFALLLSICIYLIHSAIKKIRASSSIQASESTKRGIICWVDKRWFKIVFFIIFGFTAMLHFKIYLNQRTKWMGEKSTHTDAKQYFMAGQPLAGLRLALCTQINPDSYILEPLNILQSYIFNKAIKYIPQDDAEPAIWNDLWFVYPYSKYYHESSGYSEEEISKKMINVLNLSYETIREVSTKPFSDKNIEKHKYLENFPRMTFYYSMKKGHLTGNFIGSYKKMAKNPFLYNRSVELLSWLANYEDKIKNRKIYALYLSNKPKIIVAMEISKINEQINIIRSDILMNRFSCDGEVVKSYIQTRNAFVGNHKKGIPGLSRYLKNDAERKEMQDFVTDSLAAEFMKYVLNGKCNTQVFGNVDPNKYEGYDGIAKEWFENRMKRLYKEELSLLFGEKEKYYNPLY